MAKNKFVKAWIHDHINDHYVKSATNAGFRSRAAYKLLEIDQKFNLFKNVKKAVDLGCAPGSWSQVILQKIGTDGIIVGVDLLEIEPIKGLHFIQGDFTTEEILAKLIDAIGNEKERSHDLVVSNRPGMVDLVVSDMAPNLSGVKGVDQARGAYLVELVLEFARDYLITGGKCVIKVFHGGEFDNLVKQMRALFNQVVIFKPDASRSKSSETYLLGLDKR